MSRLSVSLVWIVYNGFQAFRTPGVFNLGPNLDPNASSNPRLLTLTPNPYINTNPNSRYLTITIFKNAGYERPGYEKVGYETSGTRIWLDGRV